MNLVKHLLQRKYDPSRYVNQVLDVENCVLSVFMYNLTGQINGFLQYRPLVTDKSTPNTPDGRYFNATRSNVNSVWGLETLNYQKKDLYIVEGLFKASALHMIGENALSVNGNNPVKLRSWLHTLDFNLIGIGDDDSAGRYLPRIAGKGFQYKDLDELTSEELYDLLRERKQSM